ncbi:MAG: hypothetical protein GQ552_02740 [Flavobacteriaceae bacterium]|nr:hypothetical protein [Flavobacteriaceae bacterium]
MKKITIAVALIFSFGIMFTSCNETKKEVKEEATEQVQEVEKSEATENNHSDDMAMAAYQCPMKCEGDKTYAEAGTCPTCKMDLKKVETTNDADKAEESKEESHEGHSHD